MKTTPRSDEEARTLASRKLLTGGDYDAIIREASQETSKRGNETMKLVVVIPDGDSERVLFDYLSDSPLGAARLRAACIAVGALDKYSAGSIEPSDIAGHAVRVRIGRERKRGYPERNIIEGYSPSARVIPMRAAG